MISSVLVGGSTNESRPDEARAADSQDLDPAAPLSFDLSALIHQL